MFRFAVLIVCVIFTSQVLGTEEFQKRCLLLSGIRNTLTNMVSGAMGNNQPIHLYPPQYGYPQQYGYPAEYYYPEYEYIFVDYPPMPEYNNGYYNDNGYYYQVIEMNDGQFYSDPYFNGQGPYFLYREQHKNQDYFFTNRVLDQNIQKISISKKAFDDLSKKNENFRRELLQEREEQKQQQQPQQQQQQQQRPSNIQFVPIPVRPTSQSADRPNIQVMPLGTRQPVQQQFNPYMVQVMGRQQVPSRGPILMRAPSS